MSDTIWELDLLPFDLCQEDVGDTEEAVSIVILTIVITVHITIKMSNCNIIIFGVQSIAVIEI